MPGLGYAESSIWVLDPRRIIHDPLTTF